MVDTLVLTEAVLSIHKGNPTKEQILIYDLYRDALLFSDYLEGMLDFKILPNEVNKFQPYVRERIKRFREDGRT